MKPLHILAAILVAFIWGTNFVSVKLSYQAFTPFFLLMVRFCVTFFPLLFFIPKPRNPWREIMGFALFFWMGQFCFMFLAVYIGFPAGLAALVMQAQVVLTPLFSYFFFGTRLRLPHVLALSLSLSGILAIAFQVGSEGHWMGFFLVFLAALSTSIGNNLLKRYHFESMLGLIVWGSLLPPLPLLGLGLYFEGPEALVHAWKSLDLTCTGAVLYTAYLSTLVASTLFGKLVQRYSPATISPFLLLTPIFAMGSCAWILGETFTFGNLVASAVVIGGLVLNQLAKPLDIVPAQSVTLARSDEPAPMKEAA